ncbi:MAG TPA: hypothetical protein PLG50_02665 [bacterium]|nr:hypothetical protein [bacterium]HQG44547.1 hypothetical protein [bacterium]HQI47938.1 hypothetical protein [bacterium]HQJ64423.1 hypothetical protein [bacterium]HQJ65535.1 hypothetical protein [bacterium]
MDDQLTRLKRRAQILGNHYHKYLHVIDKSYDGLCARLEVCRLCESVHLWQRPFDYRAEMRLVAGLGRSQEEKLADLGCFFALHFLQLNLNALDTMLLDVARVEARLSVFRAFMLHVGHEVRQLVAGYMTELLRIFLPDTYPGDFVFMGVGTRSDQDDIDVGVVDSGPELRGQLTSAIARLNGEMLRKAIVTHYHLSENVCREASFSASIADYNALLDTEIHDFVIINEMLGAARILGSRALFSDFLRQVTSRYYFQPDRPELHKFHEGYLRGITGEIRSFMFKSFADDRLDPKVDGLRMIKASLFAAKTIFNLRQVNAWALIDALRLRDKRRAHLYEKLDVSLTYLEVFRFLYHLLVSQEEEIYVGDPATRDNLALVAGYMGYQRTGTAAAYDFFLADYYAKARLAKGTVRELLPDVITHLGTITTFGRLMHRRKVTRSGETRVGNLAVRFLEETKFFRGTRFWDDIIAVLRREDHALLGRLVNDLTADPERTEALLQGYIEWGWNSFIALFSFLNLLYRHPGGRPLHRRMVELFFERSIGTEIVQRFATVFKYVPHEVHAFLGSLTGEQQRRFQEIIAGALWDTRLVPARNRLSYLAGLHYASSRYLKRITNRVLEQHPAVYRLLDDPERLQEFGKGLLAEINRTPAYHERLHGIAAWHDFEFFRCCLLLFGNATSGQIADEFIYFSDTYIRLLYDTCKQRVDETGRHPRRERPALAILVTGGYGHMLAFDDDHDLIILLDSEEPGDHAYYIDILKRIHREISRSGILPHYRLGDHFGSFICTPAQIRSLLGPENAERFIDMSQLLGARMIVGGRRQWETFYREIVQEVILAQKEAYIAAMLEEITGRQRFCAHGLAPAPAHPPAPTGPEGSHAAAPAGLNLKELPGGLRDVEMLLDIFRARFEIHENSNYRLFKKLEAILPAHAEALEELSRHYELLRLVRNLNRLAVAADDQVDLEHLHPVLETWRIRGLREKRPETLEARIQRELKRGEEIMQELIGEVLV